MSSSPVSSTSDLGLYLVGFFVPPIAVAIKRGVTADLFINIALFILGWIPGVIHAWWIIGKYTRPAGALSGEVSGYGTAVKK